MSIAQEVRASVNPYQLAIALMVYRDSNSLRVVFHFEDESTLTFKKVYQIEDT